jgi:preprotein translocase SecE subunit
VKKPAKRVRKKQTLRERNDKAADAKSKPERRARRAARSTVSRGKKVGGVLTTELHLTNRKENNDDHGFFSKSRSLTPRYVANSWNEVRQVKWTGFKETWKLVFAVFVFSVIVGGFIALLDFGLEKLFRAVIL